LFANSEQFKDARNNAGRGKSLRSHNHQSSRSRILQLSKHTGWPHAHRLPHEATATPFLLAGTAFCRNLHIVERNPAQSSNATPAGERGNVDAHDTKWLLEEYKIVQAKIDKLGEDMFKVRSWCITLFTGVAAGAKLSGGLSPGLIAMLLPLVIAFQLVEYRQRQISRRSVKRARNIEALLRRTLRKTDRDVTLAPYLATSLLADGVKDKTNRTIRSWMKRKWKGPIQPLGNTDKSTPIGAESQTSSSDQTAPNLSQCLIAQADFLFYAVQYIIIAVLFAATCGATKKAEPALTLQLGTNSIRITTETTNLIVTNYVFHTLDTTNFIEKQVYTTNFIVTNVPTTNYRR
jgi:hypothetical protein